MPPPTGRYGLLTIPAPNSKTVAARYSSLANRDEFDPANWPVTALTESATDSGWYLWDVDALVLPDGCYEYEFVLDGDGTSPVADPYADEITRFGGYRGVLHIAGGVRVRPVFRWDDAVEAGTDFPQNNQIVIYEMPLKWMSAAVDNALVDLGTFEEAVFEHLDGIAALGVNCIELLPIEDTPQTLDWGYGTRFYFAPDKDMGGVVDAKFFIKSCHARGIRVILDVVMAFFAPECPLSQLAMNWFNAPWVAGGRNGWGQNLFLYNSPAYGSYYAAREFLCQMAEYWVTEYHVDGFRIDDFPDIANWDFVQEFRDRAWTASLAAFPDKPFLVVAEDTNREFVITGPSSNMTNGQKVVDGIWNFGFQQELRLLATGTLTTVLGQASRTERVEHFLSKDGTWNGYSQAFDPGYGDLSCAVNYTTSHDVANAPRMMNVILGPMLVAAGLGDGGVENVQTALDGPNNAAMQPAVTAALGQVFGVFALIMTSVGIPMFLSGEEFGDVHDTDYTAVNPKQQDPVQWQRALYTGNAALMARVTQLIQLRTAHLALQRNEIQFFYFHPDFDSNGCSVFAFARTAGNALGALGQVIVVANMGPQVFGSFDLANWPWGSLALTEAGNVAGAASFNPATGTLSLSLNAFQVRVFSC
jgi:1,4-alpha-glucan branching enzyme